MTASFARITWTTAIAAGTALLTLTACSTGANAGSSNTGSTSGADKYPTRTIEMQIGVSPGGGTDTHTRLLTPCLKDQLGQEVVVVNKPEASGLSLWNQIPKITPDGYTLALVSFPQVAGEYVKGTLKYDPSEGLTFIGNASINPTAMAISAHSKIKSLADLVQLAKASPGSIKIGTTGGGSLDYLAAESVAQASGIKFTYVPFPGTTEGIQAVLSGDIDAMGMGLVSASSFVKSGDLKLIAIGSEARQVSYPDVPTYKEQGFTILGGSPVAYFTVVAPPKLPKPVSDKLVSALKACTADQKYVGQVNAIGGEVRYVAPDEMKALVKSQIPELKKIMVTK